MRCFMENMKKNLKNKGGDAKNSFFSQPAEKQALFNEVIKNL